MRRNLAILATLATACGSPARPEPATTTTTTTAVIPSSPAPRAAADPAPHRAPPPLALRGDVDFARWLGAAGCFAIRQRSTGVMVVSDEARCAARRRPYSTFKIANALISVEAGLVTGPDGPLPLDPRFSRPDDPPAWRGPHTLRTGMAASSVPHFRTLATRLGEARMRDGLARLDYGNRDVSGGLDQFWLTGGLRISAREQVELTSKLASGALPLSAATQATVREVLRLDAQGGAALFGKTGTGHLETAAAGEPWLAWLVGWVERDGDVFAYAGWLETTGSIDEVRARRMDAMRGILDALGVYPATPSRSR